jgi:hypothetical protein
MGYAISPASLRLDDLTESIVRCCGKAANGAHHRAGNRIGSARRVVNKTVTNDEILDRAELIFRERLREPEALLHDRPPNRNRRRPGGDSRSDAADSRTDADACPHEGADRPDRRQRQSVDSETGTAYQWLPMEDPAVTDRKIKRLRSLMAGIDNVYFNIKSERHSTIRRCSRSAIGACRAAIEAAERNGQKLARRVAETGVDADFFIFRDRSRDQVLPWDIIDGGDEEVVLPGRVRQGHPGRVDASAEAAARERAAPPRDLVAGRARPACCDDLAMFLRAPL